MGYLRNLVRALLGHRNSSPSTAPPAAMSGGALVQTPAVSRPAGPVYPPVDQGIPALTVDDILAPHAALLQRLRDLAGADQSYDVRYMRPVHELARWVHLLPSTPSAAYAEPGGALRLSLELAVHSLQASHGKLFTTDGVEARHALEPRWRYACFLAGLTAEIARPVADTVVTDESGNVWAPFSQPLSDWLASAARQRYFVAWMQEPPVGPTPRTEIALIVSGLVDADTWAWLDEGSREIARAVYACGSGHIRMGDNMLANVVGPLRDKLLARDDARRHNRYGKVVVGAHLEPYIMDAMRALVEQERWAINTPGAPLWHAADGLFLIWPRAAREIIDEIDKRGVPGVPRSSTTLADIMLAARIIAPCEPGNPIWAIRAPSQRRVEGAVLVEEKVEAALRFEHPLAILANADVATLAERMSIIDVPATPTGAEQSSASAGDPFAAGGALAQARDEVPKARPRPTKAAAAQKGAGSGDLFAAPPVAAAVIPADIRASLSEAIAEVLGTWVELFNGGTRPDALARTPEGVAVCAEFASRYGLDVDRILDELIKRQFLYKTGAGGMKFIRVKFGAESEAKRAFVITDKGARALGFRLEGGGA